MRSIVERAVESVRPLIDHRRHQLTVTVPSEPLWLHADPTRMEQVVVNLLNNAAKYTDEGGRIWLHAREEVDQMVLSVRDSGIGINLERFPDLFDLFAQADRSLDHSQGGLGIGLSLVQRLVEMHLGTVEVYSEGLGLGSEFTVRIPRLSPLAGAPPSIPSTSATPSIQGRRVLVVDDNRDAAETMAQLLTITGYSARTAYSGPASLEVAAAYLPDVLLLDIGLPGLNGYEVARRLRQHPQLNGVRLIAMTGYGEEAYRRRAQDAGFDTYLVKPIDFVKVQEVLARLFTNPHASLETS
jgi:CheY-like chemotaxis protein